MLDRLVLQSAATHRAPLEAWRAHQHFAAGILGRTAVGLDRGHHHEGLAAAGPLGDAFDGVPRSAHRVSLYWGASDVILPTWMLSPK